MKRELDPWRHDCPVYHNGTIEWVNVPEYDNDGIVCGMIWASIDVCIAPLVRMLNQMGWHTVEACCGHGKNFGYIKLADGREIIIEGEQMKLSDDGQEWEQGGNYEKQA